jgi:hypothetical protein
VIWVQVQVGLVSLQAWALLCLQARAWTGRLGLLSHSCPWLTCLEYCLPFPAIRGKGRTGSMKVRWLRPSQMATQAGSGRPWRPKWTLGTAQAMFRPTPLAASSEFEQARQRGTLCRAPMLPMVEQGADGWVKEGLAT